jgi:hypothetical protein
VGYRGSVVVYEYRYCYVLLERGDGAVVQATTLSLLVVDVGVSVGVPGCAAV